MTSEELDFLTVHMVEATMAAGVQLPNTVMGHTIAFVVENRKQMLATHLLLRARKENLAHSQAELERQKKLHGFSH